MIRRPPLSTPSDPLCPYTTLFRSLGVAPEIAAGHRNDMHFIPRDELRKVLAQLVAGVGGNMVELVHRDQPIIDGGDAEFLHREAEGGMGADQQDRKSTRLNSSH